MMNIRQLELKDALRMLEWMHDRNVVKYLRTDFASKTLNDCVAFIKYSRKTTDEMHCAIVDSCDQYMGTVSLKNISQSNKTAEYAITIRSDAMGMGYAQYATKEILKEAFQKLQLESVFLCVSDKNLRAIRFYNKSGFVEAKDIPEIISTEYEYLNGLRWYYIDRKMWSQYCSSVNK